MNNIFIVIFCVYYYSDGEELFYTKQVVSVHKVKAAAERVVAEFMNADAISYDGNRYKVTNRYLHSNTAKYGNDEMNYMMEIEELKVENGLQDWTFAPEKER